MSMLGTGPAAEEILFKNPKLYNGPIVRNGSKATVGYKPEIWAEWE
jgi:arsenate reductase